MILSFKQQFVEPILNGSKIHTIREDTPGRWKAGNSIQAATGVRTKNYNCFFESECKSTQKIIMQYRPGSVCLDVTIDGRLLNWEWRRQLALFDGFDSWLDMYNWFYPIIEKKTNQTFVGKIIHWTDFKYKA